jgi:hypothetical protein
MGLILLRWVIFAAHSNFLKEPTIEMPHSEIANDVGNENDGNDQTI